MNSTHDTQDSTPRRPRRAARTLGLVLVGTAALALGMPGCDDDKPRVKKVTKTANNANANQRATTRPTGSRVGAFAGSAYAARRAADAARGGGNDSSSSNTTRSGFGSSGRSAVS